MQKAPIGIFDSGYGGLTVLKSIVAELPDYDYIYIGDNARTPYGSRSFDTVYEYTLQAVKTFFEMGCELVILACNTASAKALRSIQQNYLPTVDAHKRLLGVIRPSAEIVCGYSTSKHIGVLGTSGTVNSESYVIEIEKQCPEARVFQEACPVWVPLIENNQFDNIGGDYFVKHHLESLLNQSKDIDTIILGCTHYPILLPQIKKHLPAHIKVLSQGDIVANSLKEYLKRHPQLAEKCSTNSSLQFFTTDNPEIFEERAALFLGHNISASRITLLGS
ncbi:MAG: glutamate racemase [Flavobacteriales bacterium]|jgi:glutamate racemase